MSNLLTEEELHDEIDEALNVTYAGDIITDRLIPLIQSQKLAHANKVLEDFINLLVEKNAFYDNFEARELSKTVRSLGKKQIMSNLPSQIDSKKQPHFSSLRPDWKTPKAVYQVLDSEFRFDYDPCPANPTFDGLNTEWGGCNFVNPPYNQLKAWVKKGYEQWRKGKTVVFLIPSRTDTIAWHEYCMKATEIRFIKGRLKFDDQPNPAPFPSAIVIFKGESL